MTISALFNRSRLPTQLLGAFCLQLVAGAAFAQTPNLHGQFGYINMPNALTGADGLTSFGYSYDSPYGTAWGAVSLFPFVQLTGRYVSLSGIPGFTFEQGQYGADYGRHKDKVADIKVRLREESALLPAVAFGATDMLGTELFKGQYVAATKTFGRRRNVEATVGYGRGRPDGLFAGMRWHLLAAPGWAVSAEYDANDYRRDYRASETRAAERPKGPSVALEYRWGWLGAQVARQRNHFSANAFISIPFAEPEFVPKIHEPAPVPVKSTQRVAAADWLQQPARVAALVEDLAANDFRNVRVEWADGVLKLALTNNRISNVGRAIGRAARIALLHAPEGTQSLQISYTRLEQPVATYEFVSLPVLADYLTGLADRERLLQLTVVRDARPADRIEIDAAVSHELRRSGSLELQVGREGDAVQLVSEDHESNRFKTAPKLGFFFNDPSGALRYEVALASQYDKRLADGLYLNSALKLVLSENVSAVTQKSNSLLPHVRTDIAEYKRGNRLSLNRLVVNQYFMPGERVYARLSGGLYEEMFGGAGGQLLYASRDGRWAADVAVDAVRQRGYSGWFAMRDYRTVTALGSVHYRLPFDTTATVRAGQFLARDDGARFELKRRFASGVEIGAWYTRTNGRDTTNPGTPSNPYHDKGVFFSVPLNIMLTRDSQATAGIALSPWTRDVGQMVASPGDLYDLIEQPRRDLYRHDGLGNAGERPDERNYLLPGRIEAPLPSPWPVFRQRVAQSASALPSLPEWGAPVMFAGAAVVVAAALDKPVERFVYRHQDSAPLKRWDQAGKLAPYMLLGGAGAAVALGDGRARNIGLISLQAFAASAVLAEAGKRAVARARPLEQRDPWRSSAARADGSFPSSHAAAAFALVTPFAKEYDAPWLYGLAAGASAGRVAGRKHWVSDIAAGAVLGYASGRWLWSAQRDNGAAGVSVGVGPGSVRFAWQDAY